MNELTEKQLMGIDDLSDELIPTGRKYDWKEIEKCAKRLNELEKPEDEIEEIEPLQFDDNTTDAFRLANGFSSRDNIIRKVNEIIKVLNNLLKR